MPEDSDNPYAPPAATVVPEGLAGCWSVQGDVLVVRENAVLPPVDLDGRGAGGPLTPMVLKLPVPMGVKGILLMVLPAALILGYLSFERGYRDRSGFPGVLLIVLFSVLIGRFVKIRKFPAFVWGHASLPALRAMNRRRDRLSKVGGILLLAFFGVACAGKGLLGVAGMLLVAYFWITVLASDESRWRCTKAQDGWLWIKGIGPAGLAELAGRAGAEAPPTVRRKVFRFRLQRLTMGEWRETNGFRLSAWWQTLLMLSRKPEEQEHLSYHWSERKWLEPAEADPELVEAWRRETEGTPLAGWTMIYAERGDSPTRCIRSEEIVFLSPDGRHAAMSMVARVASGKGLLEDRRETGFRSWTEDGRILATGNRRISGPLQEEMEFEVHSGSTWELAQHHLRRAAEERLEGIDAAGLRRKEEMEMQRRHEVLEDAGIHGPVEEMELPGDWS